MARISRFRLLRCASLLLLVRMCGGISWAQTFSDSLDHGIEPLLESLETDTEDSALLDRLQWLQENPFDLNTMSKQELMTIPRVTTADAAAIIGMRKQVGRFFSIDQLAVLEQGAEILDKIRSYVAIRNDEHARAVTVTAVSRTSHDLQQRRGFRDGSFAGSSLKNFERLTLTQSGKAEGSLLFEKDAGERIGDGFVSGYATVRDVGCISSVIVGDYVVEAGQGLVLWRASSFGKGSEVTSVARKSGSGIQPYRSADEVGFLRGVAAALHVRMGNDNLAVAAFYSRRSLSATEDSQGVSSLYEAGLFRTEREMQKRNRVVETVAGARLQFLASEDWSVGSSFSRTQFDMPFITDRAFEFSGSRASCLGVDAEVNLGWLTPSLPQMNLFGEIALSGDGATAGVVGSVVNLTRNASLALAYRDYSPRCASLHASGFGEQSNTKNERGFYFGAEILADKRLRFSGYLDHFRFPWRTFDNPLPTSGRDLLLQCEASVLSHLELTLRYSNKRTESAEALADGFSREQRLLGDRLQQRLRMSATYHASKHIRLRGRFEQSFVDYRLTNRSERGTLLYQELRYDIPEMIVLEGRLIFFDTDSYDSRVYEFENDLRGVFSNPALHGKGRRWYLLARWKPADVLFLSAKYSETLSDGVKSTGSGDAEIQGDIDNRIAIQFEVRL